MWQTCEACNSATIQVVVFVTQKDSELMVVFISGKPAITHFGLMFQVVVFATQNDHEPMVAFICGKPAMHRGVNSWISDEDTKECWDDKRPILDYCKKVSIIDLLVE